MKKEDKYSVGRPKLAGEELKKKSVIISCICLVVALALLITGAFELNILKFNTKRLKGTVNTNLCGTDINIIPEELRYSETNPDGFKDIKFYSAVLSAGKDRTYGSILYNSSEYCSTMTAADLNQIKYLDVSNSGLTDVSGLGYLTRLNVLYMAQNSINNIDVSKNTLLEELKLYSNSITNINLKNNVNLTHLWLASNQLTNLDLGNNDKLTSLDIVNNKIENLDLSSNNQIINLSISKNPFKNVVLDNIKKNSYGSSSLDISGADNIENLSIKNTKIADLYITGPKKIQNLDISNNEALSSFSVSSSQIDNFVAENLNNLKNLTLNNCGISSIELNSFPNLYRITLSNNKLTSLDLSGLPELRFLSVNNNKITSIKFNENPNRNFYYFDLSNNNLSGELDLTNLKFEMQGPMDELSVNDNNLDSIKLPGETYDGNGIYLNNNNLKSIEFTGPAKVSYLEASNNKLTNIDLSNLSDITDIALPNNKLTSIDLSNITGLTGLDLKNNELTYIDVSNLTNLNLIYLSNNNLTKIDGLSSLGNLQILIAHNNKLESIDLSDNPNLNIVTLQDNPITNTRYLLKGQSIDYKNMINGDNITYNTDNKNVGTFDGSILNLKEVGQLNATASNENIISSKTEYIDKCLIDYEKNQEYCDNVNEEDVISPYFYENKVIVYDVLSNNYKVDSNNKTIDVSGLIPDTKYITLTEGLTGEIKNNKYIVKNSNNEVIEEFNILNPGKKEEEVKEVKTTTKTSSKRVIKPNKKVTTKKLEDINLTGSFISSLMLNQVKGQDRKLTVTNEDVVLTLLGKDIKSIDSNIDISYKVTNVKETEVKDKVEEGIVLEFMNKTTLPGISQIEVDVKDKVKNNADIYRYDNDSLTLIAENVKISDSKLTFNTDKLDTYVITNKLKKDVTVKEDKGLIESNDKIKKNNNRLIVIPIIAIIFLIGIGTYIYKKKIAK